MTRYPSFAIICGRILLSLVFLVAGIHHAFDFNGGTSILAAKSFPLPALFMAGAIACLIIGGVCVATGFYSRIGTCLLILFLIIATLVFHDFWNDHGSEMEKQATNFLKNLALIGGLLITFACAGERRAHGTHRQPLVS